MYLCMHVCCVSFFPKRIWDFSSTCMLGVWDHYGGQVETPSHALPFQHQAWATLQDTPGDCFVVWLFNFCCLIVYYKKPSRVTKLSEFCSSGLCSLSSRLCILHSSSKKSTFLWSFKKKNLYIGSNFSFSRFTFHCLKIYDYLDFDLL